MERGPPGGFALSDSARAELHELWAESVRAGAERAACLAAETREDRWYITRVGRLDAGGSGDSLGVSARASLERCGPPEWAGTVHTHIARQDGVRPYPMFSGSDRGVMRLWARRWGRLGLFCLLYSEHEARCEADGRLIAGPGTRLQY